MTEITMKAEANWKNEYPLVLITDDMGTMKDELVESPRMEVPITRVMDLGKEIFVKKPNMGAAASGVQTQMQAEHDPNANFPWWVRFLAKGVGIVGGFVAIFFAVLGLISFDAKCIIAVLLQLVSGFLTIALEAPFCCQFVDFIEKIAQFSEKQSYFRKAIIYVVMGIVPIFICLELNTFLGSGMIFACGCVYGFMALGKKADRNTMMAASDPAWSPQVNNPSMS